MTKARALGITIFPYIEYDSNGNLIYWEESDGYWVKREYDSKRNQIYHEDSDGYWEKTNFDSNGRHNYVLTNNGYWEIVTEKGERKEATEYTVNYPEYTKLTYSQWTDEMIIKYEHHINWIMLSFLPTLSKKIIEKYSDRLDLDIVKFFNKNL